MLRPIERFSGAVLTGTILMLAVLAFGLFLSRSTEITRVDLSADGALSRIHVIPVTDIARAIYTLFLLQGRSRSRSWSQWSSGRYPATGAQR